ncbi:pyrroline-5-carboxylate reductase [Corynebacterium choanae]|uniref:Pyrroline-5-carboxylate reductase n=1 Tax=Corynebacterium choanae TaxID=1862358 RepID=A0A3G6J8U4_9CORY|nr:pyrroline-5-carboxylate reductase [Corynebacterium choanae]AZA14487.1 Pyrroline-5-carboxylate reductase [Corynebacterium choanae]
MTNTVAIIGGGKIGEALLAGLIAGDTDPATIRVTNRREDRNETLSDTYGVTALTDNKQAVTDADVVFLCVKPYATAEVLAEIAETLDDNDQDTVVVSMAAGIPLATLEDVVSAGTAIVRVMPNTPMLVQRGMSAVAPGRFVTEEQLDTITTMLETVGQVAVVEESEMDVVTALSGSSPAYFFLFAESLIEAGVSHGLTRELARELVVTTLEGAGTMLRESEEEPASLRADVSSPGGTTVAAVRALEEHGIRAACYRAVDACAQRSKELGA